MRDEPRGPVLRSLAPQWEDSIRMAATRGSYGQDGPYGPYDGRHEGHGQGYGQDYGYGQGYGQDPGYDPYQPYGPEPRRPRVAAGRLWAGGVIVAVVAALAAFVALLLVRGVLGIPVFAPERDGTLVLASSGALAAGAAGAALLGTAVLHLLALATPQPERFLAWIVGLATLAMMLLPFTAYPAGEWPAKFGTAAVYLVIGAVIGSLLTTVAHSAVDDG